jgi:hypothetical protein
MSIAQPHSSNRPPFNPYRDFDNFGLGSAVELRRLELADVLTYIDELQTGRITHLEDLPGPWLDPENARDFLTAQLAMAEEEQQRRERFKYHPIAAATFIDRRAEVGEIKQRVDLVTFIEQLAGIQFRRVRSRHWASCPLPGHPDSSPSFAVTHEHGLWICYGCRSGGDVFTFVEIFNDLPFPQAVDLVAQAAGVNRERRTRSAEPASATANVVPFSGATFHPIRKKGGARVG